MNSIRERCKFRKLLMALSCNDQSGFSPRAACVGAGGAFFFYFFSARSIRIYKSGFDVSLLVDLGLLKECAEVLFGI